MTLIIRMDFRNSGSGFEHLSIGRFRLSVSGDTTALAMKEAQIVLNESAGGWGNLAFTYFTLGDHEALGRLLERLPQAAIGLGELYLATGKPEAAITLCDKIIHSDVLGAKSHLLAIRGRAYARLEQWEAAEADMRRSAEEDFDVSDRFEMFKDKGDWWAAAIYGERMIELDPKGPSWIDLAPVLVRGGNEDGYSAFCVRRIEADVQWEDRSGDTCKLCLLLPDAVPLDELPVSRFVQLMDQGNMPASLTPWNWGARALIAYRSGAAEEVAGYVKKQQENDPNDLARALGLACLALAEHDLGKLESYETTMKALSELLDNHPKKTHRDWLIADILRQEAEALK